MDDVYNMFKSIVAVFFICLTHSNAQDDFICNSGRPILSVIGPSFSEIVAGQPYSIVASEFSEKAVLVDNICFSYIITQRNDTLIAYDTRTRIDGSLGSSHSVTIDGGPGVTTSSSAACTYVDYGIATIEECQVNLVYRYFLYGCCKSDMSVNSAGETYALTTLNNIINETCRNIILQNFVDLGFGDRSYYFYPQKRPSSCVSAHLCSIPSRSLPDYPGIHY